MTYAQLIELLREAHSFVDPTDGTLFERIHAAMAAHDVATDWKPVPGSRTREENWDNGVYLLHVRKHRLKTVLPMWEWYAEDRNGQLGEGYATTVDAAKALALGAIGKNP